MTGTIERAVNYGLLLLFSVLALAPIVGVVLTAFHGPDALVSGFEVPDPFTVDSFRMAWTEGSFGSSLVTSAVITLTTVVFSTVCSVLSGYAFGTMRFRGATMLFYVFLFGLLMPFEATVIPLYFDFRRIGLTDTVWGVILPSTALSIAFGTFWMRAFFLSAPRSLMEAARIDGASSLGVLLRVLVPYGRPGDPDDGRPRLHVDVERLSSLARDALGPEHPHRAALARLLPVPADGGHPAARGGIDHRRVPGAA